MMKIGKIITFEALLDFKAPPSARFEDVKMSFLNLTDCAFSQE